jgi:hypothetical protein
MMKSYRKLAVVVGMAAMLSFSPCAYAEESTEAVRETTVSVELPYAYESKAYGYRIRCPKQPAFVIPAVELDGHEGEVLIFENEDYYIKHAWIIHVNAFSEDSVPNLNAISPEESVELLKGIMDSNGYEGIMLINLTEDNKAIFATTAKEIEIDEDGDGTPDATARADSQMAVLFFRGTNGSRYGLELIDNPELRDASVAAFLSGARSMQAVP